jgi:hypothetical protein
LECTPQGEVLRALRVALHMDDSSLLDFWTHHLDPMRAEVRIRSIPAATEFHGRLMGPRCRFATTVEVAYPFRRLETPGEFAAVVPEPSLWEPAKPFFYEGRVEWTGPQGERKDARPRFCFRSIKVMPQGLLLNNQVLPLRCKDLTAAAGVPAENELLELRRRGFNALLTDASQVDLRDLADRHGFLVVLPGTSLPFERLE